ncbi:hypothetical protein AAON49_00725 [Pseudotenacibaculum sp. MALMAid0570]|uniref:hypothetical protein n=1 Tax=Pseudotenacibaculum sp. MALMAid0570 TaxID=3143938 RepID=UPI0032E04717
MKRLLLWFTLFSVTGICVAQDDLKLPEVIPPSPTVASLMKFEEVPVDYYSGQPNIVIPIYSKSIGNGIGLNVALRYTTSGVKIDSRSGWVGTGWALETGGVISRTVRGIPDEFDDHRKGVYNNPDFWNYDNLSTDAKITYQWKAARGDNSSNYQYDNQLDLYQYSLLGKSGRFVIVKNGSNFEAKLLSKDDNVKIDFTADSKGKISDFIITDALGNKYTFDIEETSYSEPVTASSTQANPFMANISASGSSASISNTSAWHISKIETSNGIDLATFTYSDHTHTYEASKTRIENKILSSFSTDVLKNSFNNSIFKPRTTVSHYATTAQTKKPLKITFKDGSSVNFSAANTHPETFGAVLNSVSIKDKINQTNKTFNFTYETTNRLWLTKVSEVGGSLIQNTVLEYNDKANLPGYGYGSDLYGYNSGSSSQGSFDITAIQKGLLKKISYPTGGNKQFYFEHNTFSYERDQSLTNDDYYKLNPANTSSTNSSLSYTINSTNGLNYTLGNNTVVIGFDQTVSIENNITIPSNVDGSILLYAVIEKNGFNYKEVIQPQGTNSVFLEAGTYTFKIEVLSLTLDSYNATGLAKLYYRNQSTPFIQAALGGGVRIGEISFWDSDNAIKASRRIYYDYNEPGTTKSSGAIDAVGAGLQKTYSYNVNKLIFLFPSNGLSPNGDPIEYNGPCPTAPSTIQYQTIEKGPNTQLTKGNYVGYKQVRVFELGNGYTDYEYTTAYDFPTPAAAFTYPFTPVENVDFKRGNLLSQKVYNETGSMLKEVTNNYNYVSENIAPSFRVIDYETCGYSQLYLSYLQYKNKTPEGGGNPPMDGNSGGGLCFDNSLSQNCGTIPPDLTVFNDDLKTGWVQLIETKTKDFPTGVLADSIVTRQTFAYNNVNFLQSVSNSYIKEKGVEKHYKTETIYPVGNLLNDFTSTEQVAISAMVGINKINVPLLVKTSVDGTVTNRVKNIYSSFYTNMYEVSKVVTSKTTDAFEDRLIYHGYYDNGNIKEVSKEDGTHIVYIWGYDQTLPVAKIENATFADIPTSVYNDIIAASNADTSVSAENTLRTHLETLRNHANLSNALVTTITYDPLVGVTSVTDPRGESVFYYYDTMNRLDYVKDAYGKILSKNEYHYKN